jgi:maleamate amidohydrolase
MIRKGQYEKIQKASRIGFGSNPVVFVIDFQNDFVNQGAPFDTGALGRKAASGIATVLSSARKNGIRILYTKHEYTGDPVLDGIMPVKTSVAFEEGCRSGTSGFEIVNEVRPQLEDYVITKRRYSAFFGTNLDTILQGLRPDTIVLTGVTTGCCVRSTCLDAFYRNYKTIVPRDCTGDETDEMYEYNLFSIDTMCGDVVDSKDVIDYFDSLNKKN